MCGFWGHHVFELRYMPPDARDKSKAIYGVRLCNVRAGVSFLEYFATIPHISHIHVWSAGERQIKRL